MLSPRLLLFCVLLTACGKESVSVSGFQELPNPIAEDLSSIAFSDSLRGTITGGSAWKSGFFLNTYDGGLTWKTDTMLDRKMEHVCFDVNGQGYAGGQDGLWYRPAGAEHWRVFRIDYQWIRACHFPDGKRGAMVGGEGYHGGIAHTFGPEPFWATDTVQTFPNEIQSVWYSDPNTLHAVGFGWVMRSSDAGRTWQRLDITGDFFQSVHFPSATTGYACGSSGTILKTSDAGASWREIRQGGSTGNRRKAFRSIWFASPDRGWVVGDGGIFWQTDDGGNTWNPVAEAPEAADFTCVVGFGQKGWATAKKGRLFCFEL